MIVLRWADSCTLDNIVALTWSDALHALYSDLTAIKLDNDDAKARYTWGRLRIYAHPLAPDVTTAEQLFRALALTGMVEVLGEDEEEDTNQSRYRLSHALDDA